VADQFKRLAALDDAAFDRLAAAVEAASPSLGPHRLWHDVADRAGLDFEMVDTLLDGVLSATAIGARDGLSPVETAQSLRIEDLETPRETFESRVARLMSSRAVGITVKALDLAVSDEKVLLRARIITDVRPVFPEALEPAENPRPDSVLVKHSLRMEYLQSNESRTFVVSLDSVDVTRLRDALDRAERKAGGLSELIAHAGVEELHVERGDDE
jgi:hypothetical protein